MINYNELRDGQAFYSNGYKKGYEDAKNEFERPQGDLISRTWLKEHKFTTQVCNGLGIEDVDVVGVATIDNAPPIETTIEDLISTLSVEELKATTWFKVETPSGEAVSFRREKTGHWLYRYYNWWCSECGKQPKTMGYVGTAEFMYEEFKFCNHCGAKMIGVEKIEFFERRQNVLEDRESEK